MKKILSAALAVSLVASAGAASAATYAQHNQQVQRLHHQAVKAERKADKAERKADKAQIRYERAATRRYYAGRYQRPAHYQQRQWRHGERLPSSYRTSRYVVDYHRYHLQAPPRGYQYTRVGNDVVLTSVASGLIASVIYGLFQ